MQGKGPWAKGKTDGILQEKKARIFECEIGPRREEVMEPAERSKHELSMVLQTLLLLVLLEQKEMKHLHSRVPAQVEGSTTFCSEGLRVLLGREFVKHVLAERDFARAMSRKALMCQNLWYSRCLACEIFWKVSPLSASCAGLVCNWW